MNRRRFYISLTGAFSLGLMGCGQPRVQPVEIFPEDNCSNCRMAISGHAFASEIITDAGEALKFDDLGCLASYRKKHTELQPRAIFVVDYDSKQWLPYGSSVIVATGLQTPMGSGQVAVRDSNRARIIAAQVPPGSVQDSTGCCSGTE